jgi:hypothetical protein
MKQWPPDSRFHVSPDTLMKSFDDKVALAHMRTKRFHLLNPTAALIWKQICAGNTRAEIEESIRRQFDVDSEKIAAGIDQVLTTLSSENFIAAHS